MGRFSVAGELMQQIEIQNQGIPYIYITFTILLYTILAVKYTRNVMK